jgi:hypothetical protein
VRGRAAARGTFPTDGAKGRKNTLRFVGLALGTTEPFVAFAHLLDDLKPFFTTPAFIFVNGHVNLTSLGDALADIE